MNAQYIRVISVRTLTLTVSSGVNQTYSAWSNRKRNFEPIILALTIIRSRSNLHIFMFKTTVVYFTYMYCTSVTGGIM